MTSVALTLRRTMIRASSLLWIAIISSSLIEPTRSLYRHCEAALSVLKTTSVVGGIESAYGAWPWQVAVLFRGKQVCGGSLVAPSWVVTAAHCFTAEELSADPSDWSVTLGEHHLKNREVFEEQRLVDKIIVHPRYRYEGDASKLPPYYDIALIKLEVPAKLSVFVWPICLLKDDIKFEPGKECVTTGWGHTKYNGNQPDTIREAKVWLIPHDICNSETYYEGRVHDLGLCADVPEGVNKEGTGSPCNFDSGGPAGLYVWWKILSCWCDIMVRGWLWEQVSCVYQHVAADCLGRQTIQEYQ